MYDLLNELSTRITNSLEKVQESIALDEKAKLLAANRRKNIVAHARISKALIEDFQALSAAKGMDATIRVPDWIEEILANDESDPAPALSRSTS